MKYELSNGQDRVYQWDHDIILTILEPENVPTVHFRWGGKAVPLTVTNQQVEIPPELMQLPKDITLWAYTPDHTMDMARIPLEKRTKPSDYAYTPTEVKTWEQLDERIAELEKGGGIAGVSSVNGETGAVTITAKGLGALTEDDLQEATNAALAQAKASGEFDGAQGPKGETGPQGPAGPTGPAGAGLDVTGATVGQTVKISAVDENGTPTAWVPVDLPSGGTGAEAMTKLGEWSVPDDASTVGFVQEYDLASLKKFTLILKIPSCTNTSARWRTFIRFGASQKQYYLYNQSFSAQLKRIAVIELTAYGTKISYKCYVRDDYGETVEFGFQNGNPVQIGIIDNAKANPANASAFGIDVTGSTTDYLDGMTAELWG